MITRNRILFYLFLALFCYTIASRLTAEYSVIIFLVVAFVAEILVWFNVFSRKDSEAKNLKQNHPTK